MPSFSLFSSIVSIALLTFSITGSFSLDAAAPSARESQAAQAQKEREQKEKATQKRKEELAIRKLLQAKVEQAKEARQPPGNYSSSDLEKVLRPYTYPGVIAWREGGWRGGDNLYNLGNRIAVTVDINAPPPGSEEEPFPVQEEAIRKRIASIFEEAGIGPLQTGSFEKAPLPLFCVVIMAQPFPKGYAFFCAANLLEEVDLKRTRFDEGTFQAVTWERQHMVVVPAEQVAYHVGRCVDDLAYSFLKVYRYYQGVPLMR